MASVDKAYGQAVEDLTLGGVRVRLALSTREALSERIEGLG